MTLLDTFDTLNRIAFAIFIAGWASYSWLADYSPLSRNGLTARMNHERAQWMRTLLGRDLRMIDTAIMAGLQQGTAFFASSCIFAIGGCFALMGSAEQIAVIARDLPVSGLDDRGLVEAKLLGLMVIFALAFFKFGWAYRLFNYCTILIGAIPMRSEAEADPDAAERALARAARMNIIAGRHFNSGLRTVFFGVAYLGWFLGPVVLILTTAGLAFILYRRQFRSDARQALGEREAA
ncbi:DUF599 domain-containing protein [Aureimonas frigidaquae]|uniref:Transmembrane protein n=1 Tax=Aureimonas frigidaquae TaxID=424757 RepID=A0A0P0Z321_9HYPH|nr:DUF599 family protein [Aureimonas frigidaquae]BAT28380.1 hypothetical protein [Aureimonas frigidaquae]